VGFWRIDGTKLAVFHSGMADALDEITKEAMSLSLRQRLTLAEVLLESAESESDADADAAWADEIRDRIRAVDEGRAHGIAFEEVMRAADERLSK
jgi:putative addiction module component (TIGR02574 family)